MMTKKEVAQVIAYCDENKIGYKLGIIPWSFYDAKCKCSLKEEGENVGKFIHRIPGNENNREALRELLPDR